MGLFAALIIIKLQVHIQLIKVGGGGGGEGRKRKLHTKISFSAFIRSKVTHTSFPNYFSVQVHLLTPPSHEDTTAH